MTLPHDVPMPFAAAAPDGYLIKGFAWRHAHAGAADRPVVIINAATSVRCRYYFRFAEFLFREGMDVLVYDYRGIGESRPASLRGFDAGWIDWGCLDFEALLRYAAREFPGQPIEVVGHSAGGLVIGLADSNHLVRRVFTVGAQYAWWPDYAPGTRWRMLAKWHVVMPALTLLFGYFPGRRLGWLEDTPRGVVRDWALSRKRFETTWRGRAAARTPARPEMLRRFAAVTAPTLAVSVTDDPFGTMAAVQRLLAYFSGSRRTMIEISPEQIGERAIGHFAFFRSRFEPTLWQIALDWLRSGRMPDDAHVATAPAACREQP